MRKVPSSLQTVKRQHECEMLSFHPASHETAGTYRRLARMSLLRPRSRGSRSLPANAPAVGQALLNPGFVSSTNRGGRTVHCFIHRAQMLLRSLECRKVPLRILPKVSGNSFPIENPRLHTSERSRQMCFQQRRTQFKDAEDQRENGKQKGNSPLCPQ